MSEAPEEREFGPPVSRNRRLLLGASMIVALIGLVLLAIFAGTPSG